MTKNAVPSTYDEVFRDYFDLALWHVAHTSISNQEVEDVAMAIMEKFIQNRVLEDYDEERANFRTFFSGFVRAYLLHHINRDRIRLERSAISIDMEISSDSGSSIPLLDALGKVTEDDTESVDMAIVLERVRARVPEKRKLFFDFVVLQLEEYGRVNVPELASLFGVSRQGVDLWFRALRPIFAQELANA